MKNKAMIAVVESMSGKAMVVVEEMLAKHPKPTPAAFAKIDEARKSAEPFSAIEQVFDTEKVKVLKIDDDKKYEKAMNSLTDDWIKAGRIVRKERQAAKKTLDDAAIVAFSEAHRFSSTVGENMHPAVRESILRTFWEIADERRAEGFEIVAKQFLKMLGQACKNYRKAP